MIFKSNNFDISVQILISLHYLILHIETELYYIKNNLISLCLSRYVSVIIDHRSSRPCWYRVPHQEHAFFRDGADSAQVCLQNHQVPGC